MDVLIIIPAYNEEKNIGRILTDIGGLKLDYKKRIVLVDDGSTDKTLEVAKKFKNKLNIKFVVHEKNKGVPATFYDGLKTASETALDNDVIFIIEGDNTSDLTLMPKMAEMVSKGADIVVASRYIKGGRYKNFPFHRVLGSYVVNYALKIFFYKKDISDYTIFYRAYSAKAVKLAVKKYKSNLTTTKSFAANLEILLKIGEFSKKQGEVPLVYDYGLKKGKSKMKLLKTLFEYKDLIIKRILGHG